MNTATAILRTSRKHRKSGKPALRRRRRGRKGFV